MEQKKPAFEHTTCPRCGGSGQYSYNAMHGTRCYGCGGTGFKLTKRGAAAAQYLKELRSKRAGDVQVGELMRYDDIYTSFFITVDKVEVKDNLVYNAVTKEESREVLIEGFRNDQRYALIVTESYKVRMGFDGITKQEQLKQALAYQATLTKEGKPRK